MFAVEPLHVIVPELNDRGSRRTGSTQPVRRATAYMQDHPAEPVTLAQIAAISGLTERGLQNAFRRTMGITPLEYLRRVRLTAAHDDLLAADPSADTVAAVARRWRFPHPSRFAGAYQSMFGEYPSETLKRDAPHAPGRARLPIEGGTGPTKSILSRRGGAGHCNDPV